MAVTSYYSLNGRLMGQRVSDRVDYLFDASGSVTATTNNTATVLITYRFKPFGALLAKTGAAADPKYLWLGCHQYRTAANSRLSYVRQRHFAPMTATWMSADPELMLGNQFAYVESNPLTYYDPGGALVLKIPTFWNDDDVFDRISESEKEICRLLCQYPIGFYPRHDRRRGYYSEPVYKVDADCYRKCLGNYLWIRRQDVYKKWMARGIGDIKPGCCKVHVYTRRAWYSNVYHPFIWLDKNCNNKVARNEVYGYDKPDSYAGPTCLKEDYHSILNGRDFSDDPVFRRELPTCSCACLAAWFESNFGWENPSSGEGRPWCPSRYPTKLTSQGEDVNSIGFIRDAIRACCPGEENKNLICYRFPWQSEPSAPKTLPEPDY